MSTSGAQMCGMPAHPMGYQPQVYPMEQNPTTSQPQWNHNQHGPPQANPYQQMTSSGTPNPHERPQYPRSPSRSLRPETQHSVQTAHWMNQHYMNGSNWAYSASPVPSIAPSVISQSQYPDDVSVLSVNTAITGHGQGDVDSQRCFSSNGSTCENINPDMAYTQMTREAEYVLHNWFTVRDPLKRCEFAQKLLTWVRNKGLLNLDENSTVRYVQQISAIIADGLIVWSPPGQPHPPEYVGLACRLLELLHKVVQHKRALMVVAAAYHSTEGERSLKELLAPFIALNQDPRFERCSYIVIEFITTILQLKNADSLKIPFLKAVKFHQQIIMLLKHLHESAVINVHVLVIIRHIISRDAPMKKFLIRYSQEDRGPIPPNSLIRVLLDAVIPRCHNSQKSGAILSHTSYILRALLSDTDAIQGFVKLQGVTTFCTALHRINDAKVARDVFNLFLHVSDSTAFNEVDIPLPFILHIINYYQDQEIFKLGSGFLSNLVANKPRYKKDAIQNNAIQLLDMIISKFPRYEDIDDEKKKTCACEIFSNSLRTLINLMPFWVQNAHLIIENEAKQNEILATVHKFSSPMSLQRFQNYLSCNVQTKETANMLELRSYILRFLTILIKMPFVQKAGMLEVVDDAKKENIISHVLSTYMWTCELYVNANDQMDKNQKEKLIERCFVFIVNLIDQCQMGAAVANQCRYAINCPMDLIRETQNEGFVGAILEFCEKIATYCDDITSSWSFDRAMVEGLTNNRNAAIAKAANSLLSRMPVTSSEPLADVFANSEFY